MRRALLLAVLLLGCSYILPATWRSFRADPDDAAPAVTRALDARNLQVVNFDQANHKIVTDWVSYDDGVKRVRQRFVVRWERDETEKALTMYVRHEAQDQDLANPGEWSGTYHDTGQETKLMDEITEQLKAMQKPM